MRRIVLKSETDWDGWRQAARALIQAGVEPETLTWSVGTLPAGSETDQLPKASGTFHVPRTLVLLEKEWAPAKKFGNRTAELEETRFLVDAVAATPQREAAKSRARPIEDRVVWVIDLFARLERRDQLQRTGSFR